MTIQTLGSDADAITLHDYAPAVEDFETAVVAGLSAAQKTLPCKFFYDEQGSHLFDRICELPEYYPTRTETRIMRRHGRAMAEELGANCLLVEYGSGSSIKTRLLLEQLRAPAGYVPIDISGEHLVRSSQTLAAMFPEVTVQAVCADYTQPFTLPAFDRPASSVVAYFPGSTIGNFEPEEAIPFLRNMRDTCGRGSGLLIGVDLKKDPNRLHAAYNDAAGVTAAFNLNILRNINRSLGANFDVDAFRHYACYNPRLGRVEMHLVSLRSQYVRIGGRMFGFGDGESIHTENCYKYTLEQFQALARQAGYRVERVWVDDDKLFSVQYLRSL